jgi:MFS family permease
MAEHIMQGKLLYKDMFLTNLPFFPYLSVLYLTITRNITLFYGTVLVEVVATATVIYITLRKPKRPRSIPLMAAGAYLFSMIVLATSDHQTGIFFASLMASLAYFWYTREKYVLSGIALGLMFVTKGYMLPILGAFFLYDIYTRKKMSWNLIIPALSVISIVLLPTLLFARNEMISNIFGYTMNRPTGLDKKNVLFFFIFNQWLFCIAILYAWVQFRKNVLIALCLAFGVAFLLLYQDIYFFYLNMLVPFACIALANSIEFLNKKIGRLNGLLVATLFISFSMLLNYKTYSENLAPLQKVKQFDKIAQAVTSTKPEYIFGAVEIVPALSYSTKIPLLNDIIDTNESLFARKVYDLAAIKKDIYSHKTVVVTLGVDRDLIMNTGEKQHVVLPVIPQLFTKLEIEKKCKKILSQPVIAEGLTNRINVWKCFK